MLRSEQLTEEAVKGSTSFAPAVRDLLDHVAAELAAEYVRLMEAAAEAELRAEPSAQDRLKETTR